VPDEKRRMLLKVLAVVAGSLFRIRMLFVDLIFCLLLVRRFHDAVLKSRHQLHEIDRSFPKGYNIRSVFGTWTVTPS
jgi:hypothetical protein